MWQLTGLKSEDGRAGTTEPQMDPPSGPGGLIGRASSENATYSNLEWVVAESLWVMNSRPTAGADVTEEGAQAPASFGSTSSNDQQRQQQLWASTAMTASGDNEAGDSPVDETAGSPSKMEEASPRQAVGDSGGNRAWLADRLSPSALSQPGLVQRTDRHGGDGDSEDGYSAVRMYVWGRMGWWDAHPSSRDPNTLLLQCSREKRIS